ncbi:MAG: Rpn family recombination-promoting nuclease/putative transposase [Polyangiaceae bacterium]
MPTRYLNPTLDVVFKMLLLKEPALLRDMIQAVLGLDVPIGVIEVLNPDVEKELPSDKGIVLDLRVRLANGHQIGLEMQSANPAGTRPRFLYYWARLYSRSLKAGDGYTSLRPTISILWFKQPLLQVPAFHTVFHVAGDGSHEIFTPELEFHVLELAHVH